jgi:hypothetical protein
MASGAWLLAADLQHGSDRASSRGLKPITLFLVHEKAAPGHIEDGPRDLIHFSEGQCRPLLARHEWSHDESSEEICGAPLDTWTESLVVPVPPASKIGSQNSK